VAVGDFNGDGKLDLLASNWDAGTLSILPGNGDGTFQQAVDLSVGSFPHDVAIGDVNRDGRLDVVIAHNAGLNSVSVLLGNGFRPQRLFLIAFTGFNTAPTPSTCFAFNQDPG